MECKPGTGWGVGYERMGFRIERGRAPFGDRVKENGCHARKGVSRLIAPKVYTLYDADKLAFVVMVTCRRGGRRGLSVTKSTAGSAGSRCMWTMFGEVAAVPGGSAKGLLQEFACPRRKSQSGVNTR